MSAAGKVSDAFPDARASATCAGWLMKKAQKSKAGWKKRWFELHGNILSYFKKKTNENKPRGVMTLTWNSEIKLYDVEDGVDTEANHCIQLTTPISSVIIVSLTKEDEKRWISHLKKVIKTIKELHDMRNPTGASAVEPEACSGMYTFTVQGSKFHVDKRYKLIKSIGHGAYGVVISARDEKTREKVAIKKVANAFEDLVDAKRILREIKLLRHFRHSNIIGIVDVQRPPSLQHFNDVYIITDLMETDLHRVIYSKQVLSDDHVRYFIYQILKALKYMHSAGVLHRDIKPSNLLLNADCDVKLCDFGLARGVEDEEHTLTEYVVTRWYRAPEIMLACPTYTSAIDVWATGCILAELYGRQPIFPGNDYLHQLKLITDYVGTPNAEGLSFVTSARARKFMLDLPRKMPVEWSDTYPSAHRDAHDLLSKMLQFNPEKRISVDAALKHPFMKKLYTGKEPSCKAPFQFDEEELELSRTAIQKLIYAESDVRRRGSSRGRASFESKIGNRTSSEGVSRAGK